jgi:hypothetical protein
MTPFDAWKCDTNAAFAHEREDPEPDDELCEFHRARDCVYCAEYEALYTKRAPSTGIVQSMVRTGEYRVAANDMESPAAELQRRIAHARRCAVEALKVVDKGHSMPLAMLGSLLQTLVAELGCAGCGQAIELRDVREIEYVRAHGVHATGDCFEMAKAGGAL